MCLHSLDKHLHFIRNLNIKCLHLYKNKKNHYKRFSMAMKSMIAGNANKDQTILNFNPMLSFANETIKVF